MSAFRSCSAGGYGRWILGFFELGALPLQTNTKTAKLPNISASVHRLQAAIAELQARRCDLTDVLADTLHKTNGGFWRMTSRRPARWAGGLTTGAAVSTPRFSGPRLSQLKAVFGPGAKKLAAAEAKIVSELVAVQGGPQPALDALTSLNLQRLQRRCIPVAHSKRSSRCLHCSDARPPGIVTLHSDWSPGGGLGCRFSGLKNQKPSGLQGLRVFVAGQSFDCRRLDEGSSSECWPWRPRAACR